MRRGGRFGEFALWIEGFQRKTVVVDDPHRAVGAGPWGRRNGRAFKDLAAVQGQSLIEALHNRQRREAGWIVRPSAQHHLGAGGQRPLERFDTHLGDDIGALFNGFVGQLGHKVEGGDFAVIQRLMHDGFLDVIRDQRHGKRQLLFLRNLMDDLPAPLQVRGRAGAAGRADHHRNTVFYAGDDHIAQIAFHSGSVGKGFTCSQIMGAGIG